MKKRAFIRLAFLLLALSACARPAGTLAPVRDAPSVPSRAQDAKNGYFLTPAGLADDFPEETTTVEKIRRDLDTVRKTGARYFRFAIGWDGVETEPDQFRWGYWDELVRLAPEYGVVLLPYVCYTPQWLSPKTASSPEDFWRQPPVNLRRFGRFMAQIASRYAGRIASWELWNEPDLENYWLGSPVQFAEMVIDAARQVRKADPGARIVLGGMANGRGVFLENLLRTPGILKDIDVVNMHGYFETWGPEPVEAYPEKIRVLKSLIDATAPGRDLWLAEFGYSDWRYSATKASPWVGVIYDYEHTRRYQAVMLWKAHVMAIASEALSLMTWYRIHDLPQDTAVIGDNNNKHLGILDVSGKPKPAYAALKLFNRIFDHPSRAVSQDWSIRKPKNSQSVVHAFEESDGNWIVTGWLRSSRRDEVKDRSGRARDLRRETVSIRLPLQRAATWKVFTETGELVKTIRIPPGGEVKGIRLRGSSIYIAEVLPDPLGGVTGQ